MYFSTYQVLDFLCEALDKNGFVVDSSDTEENISGSSTEDSEEDEDCVEDFHPENDIVNEDIGSELSEESYDYDSDTK